MFPPFFLQMKSSIRVIKDHPRSAESLLNALRYTDCEHHVGPKDGTDTCILTILMKKPQKRRLLAFVGA